jgi:uncharacterized protein
VSRLTVVFDTNVLFSGTAWKGAPFRCLEFARARKLEGITCRPILDELAEKLAAKLRFSDEQIGETLADLLSFLRLVEIPGTLRVIQADPDDNKVIECAVVASASHVVTGDRRHLLPLGSYQGIVILDASRLAALIETDGATQAGQEEATT